MRCGGIFSNSIITNVNNRILLIRTVKQIRKSEVKAYKKVCQFFGAILYIQSLGLVVTVSAKIFAFPVAS